MMGYYEITVGGKQYKLRVRMRDHAELNKAFGGSFLQALTDEKSMSMEAWQKLGDLLHVALRAYEIDNGKFTRDQVNDLIDACINEGWAMDDAIDCIMKIAAVSGFFPKRVAEDIMRSNLRDMEDPEEPAQT